MAERQPPTSGSGPLHPDDELLVAYLTTTLHGVEEHSVDAHIHTCDTCLGTLQSISRRISAATKIATPVPDAVARRVAPHPAQPSWWNELGARFSNFLRLPVLVPVAVGAGLIVALTVSNVVTPSAPRELTRAVPLRQQNLRVTAAEASVRNQPNSHADVVATVPHGTMVELRGEDRDWYHVVVADGREGWVDRRAFE